MKALLLHEMNEYHDLETHLNFKRDFTGSLGRIPTVRISSSRKTIHCSILWIQLSSFDLVELQNVIMMCFSSICVIDFLLWRDLDLQLKIVKLQSI